MTMSINPDIVETAPMRNGTVVPRVLTLKQIGQLYVPVNERTYWRWMATGEFPKPDIKHGPKLQFWHRETVETWFTRYVREHQVKKGA